ncbi:hypothetical protein [Rubellimicrobium aerolatum]|uniref:Uncharacterized protein n=1 Tax=Rubellimicrobium aerolatum TaxID=490979 RepID=A0ABW0SFF8_9RHOB|nr:hypothetical protein [Rubellimicrobium aerolatum]MBP1807142.1 hypothetical protein [Rubellimicrobium aerolatum]
MSDRDRLPGRARSGTTRTPSLAIRRLVRLLRREDGGASVDWVVLTAALASLAAVLVLGLRDAATDPADSIGAYLEQVEVE